MAHEEICCYQVIDEEQQLLGESSKSFQNGRKQLEKFIENLLDNPINLSPHEGETRLDYEFRIREETNLIPYWSMEDVNLNDPHPYQDCRAIVYESWRATSMYEIVGPTWFDLWITVHACVLMAEGIIEERYIEGFRIIKTTYGDSLCVEIGT